MVRAKFMVSKIAKQSWGGSEITFYPQYDTTIEEDRRFSKATPSGSLIISVDNPPAEAFFELGKQYYLDFTKAAE